MSMEIPQKILRASSRGDRRVRRRPTPSSGFFRGSVCKSKKKGTVLLMALIVMSSVVISSIGLGSLILSSLQQTRAIDSAVVAYYAAESGAEEALLLGRRTGALPSSVPSATPLTNGATWKRTVTSRESVVYAGTVFQDSLTEFALYDTDTQTPTGIATVKVSWTDQCAGCTVLGASLVGWLPGSTWDPSNAANVDFAAATYTGGAATLSVPSPSKLYRLRLMAKNGAMDNVQVRGFDAGSVAVPLPGRIKIDARGDWGGVEQKLLVTLPRQTPLSGVYDFVLFSECSIVKGGAISCP